MRREDEKVTRRFRVEEIDNFEKTKDIARPTISLDMQAIVKQFGEKEVIEPCLKSILAECNSTGHGPTELADIITDQIRISDRARRTAFVNKGKSFQKIKQQDVSHQFNNARDIAGLELMVFLHVGDVDDKALSNFYKATIDQGCDSLRIDRIDLARIMIAYGFMCQNDGTLLTDGCCSICGGTFDETPRLLIENEHCPKYTILRLTDQSHSLLKRYAAHILVDPRTPNEQIKVVAVEATKDIKRRNYYRDNLTRSRWEGHEAGAVWLYIYTNIEAEMNRTWKCMTSWVDPRVPEDAKPLELNIDERVDGVGIWWNRDYDLIIKYVSDHTSSKEDAIRYVETGLKHARPLIQTGIALTFDYQNRKLEPLDYEKQMQEISNEFSPLFTEANNLPHAPVECKDYDEAYQNIIMHGDTLFSYFSPRAMELWSRRQRDALVVDAISDIAEAAERFKHEEKKLAR